MPCESCNTQFTIFKHKKSCGECRRLYCVNCLQKTRRRSLCSRCVIFTKRPLTRNELGRLKPKDLIIYLQSKHIPTAGCVEKDDLVNLVLAHVDSLTSGGAASPPPSSNSSSSPSPGSHYENIRSYLNNLTSPPSAPAAPSAPPPPPPRQPRENSSNSFFGTSSSGAGGAMPDNPFSFLRQGCQVILENVTDKLTNNFSKFEAGAPSRSSNSSPSSATSPSTSTQPPINTRQPAASSSAAADNQRPDRSFRDVRVPETEPATSVPRPNGAVNRPKPRVPFDSVRRSESGCECSEDEESKQLRTTSQSTSNLLQGDEEPEDDQMAVPGTSGYHSRNPARPTVPISRSKGSTLSDSSEFSSYEELNVVTAVPQKEEQPAEVQQVNNNSNEGVFPAGKSNRVITRRRSEGCLSGHHNKCGLDIPRELSATKFEQQQQGCCSRCGRRKNELKRRLKRFHDQLTALSTQDVEVRQHLEAILVYLERKRVSVVLSQGEEGPESPEESLSASNSIRRRAAGPSVGVSQESVPREPSDPKKPEVVYTRRFVKLDDIKTSTDLEDLSVKQLKEILVLNRVDFKGCCEKKELIERVRRLLDDYHACPSVDKLPTDDLCKICMDAPIECIILECGHMATCTNCGKVLSECPICRQFIIRVVRFFRA